MFMLSSVIVLARERSAGVLDINAARIKKWGGWVLAAVGAWLIALGIWAGYFAAIFPV
jgi:hypothetical protein